MAGQPSSPFVLKEMVDDGVLAALFGFVPGRSWTGDWLVLPDDLSQEADVPLVERMESSYDRAYRRDVVGMIGPVEWLVGFWARIRADERTKVWRNLKYVIALEGKGRNVVPLLLAQIAAVRAEIDVRIIATTNNALPLGVVDAGAPDELVLIPQLCHRFRFLALDRSYYQSLVGFDELELGQRYEVLERVPQAANPITTPLRLRVTARTKETRCNLLSYRNQLFANGFTPRSVLGADTDTDTECDDPPLGRAYSKRIICA